MYTWLFKRDNETIRISDYGFEIYVNNELVQSGCVENIEEDIESLLNEGFEEAL